MMTEIEPHPDLIEYFNITNNFKSDLQVNIFSEAGENYNILSDINQNIFLLKNLDKLGLLKDENYLCDCGLGLGNTLFEIYLQSKEIDKKFHFTGIEKQKVYLDYVSKNLLHLWNDLEIINCDIMDIDYSKFNIIYSYSPFNNYKQLKSMYQKITSDIKSGSLIIEHANNGKGHFDLLSEILELEEIKLDWISVFKKS
jgi:hypothetical protein